MLGVEGVENQSGAAAGAPLHDGAYNQADDEAVVPSCSSSHFSNTAIMVFAMMRAGPPSTSCARHGTDLRGASSLRERTAPVTSHSTR